MLNKVKNRLQHIYQRLRILKYRLLSNCQNVEGTPHVTLPLLLAGKGKIKFNGRVHVGVNPSPYYYNGYMYMEARSPGSVIEFGDEIWINNNSIFVSDGPGIFIGSRTSFGSNCEVYDSDFHDMHPDRRMTGVPKTAKVVIEENVFIASNVKIMKGVTIGKNSIISHGAVVTRSVPENSVVAGNPAKVVQRIDTTGDESSSRPPG